MSWLDSLTEIAKDFEHADVVNFKFSRINKVNKCWVTTRNADKELVTWRLVDDGVSTDRWQKVPDHMDWHSWL